MTELQRLEFLDSCIWTYTRDGLTALATKHFLEWQFHGLGKSEQKQIFKTHVANNFLYQANSAMIERAIVNVHDKITAEDKIETLSVTFPDKADLRKHRIVISHPSNVIFGETKVQEFFDNDEHYKSNASAVRLFRTRQVLLRRLKELGSTRDFPNEIAIQAGTLELVEGVLLLSLQPGQSLPFRTELHRILDAYFKSYGNRIEEIASEPR